MIILLLGSLLFTGCGEAETVEVDTGVLHLALRDGIYADVVEACLPAFEEAYSVTCEVTRFSEEDLHNTVLGKGTDGISYDVVMVDGSWTAELTEQGMLANLSELGCVLDNDIIPATTRISYYNESIYLMPFYGNVTVLLYNKKLMEQYCYDPNRALSLRDLLSIAEKAKVGGKNGFLYRGDTPNNLVVDFLPILLSHGGWVVDQNNQPLIDTQVFRDAMSYYLRLIRSGKAMEKASLIESIDSGESCMAVAWPGWYTPTADTAADYSALSGKLEPNSVAYNANVYGIWMLGVSESSSNQKMAAALVSHLMDKDVQRSTIEIGGVPCRYSSLQDPDVLAVYPQYDAVAKALQGGTYRPVMKDWTTFYTILGTEMDAIIKGEKEMDQGIKDAQVHLEQALNSGTNEFLDRRE
ncbi:MAG: extracellular solute-binding protein [Lachnospiraceae bacterium]|nr:extracellular solute-binding protein [Lachnospiraceae bacterium]